jgi:hypothetical protein
MLAQVNRPSDFAILLNEFQLTERILHSPTFSLIFLLANHSDSTLLSLSLQNLQKSEGK